MKKVFNRKKTNYRLHKRAVAFQMMMQHRSFVVNHINYQVFYMDSQRLKHSMHMSDIVKEIAEIIFLNFIKTFTQFKKTHVNFFILKTFFQI